jgi:hypothetical protein
VVVPTESKTVPHRKYHIAVTVVENTWLVMEDANSWNLMEEAQLVEKVRAQQGISYGEALRVA